jgi:malonyl-CoA O-methyltransferase
LCADALQLPLRDSCVDLVFASLLLHWVDDLDGLFSEVRRVLRPGGFFAFATLGPDTLHELRHAWAEAGDAASIRVMGQRDMHDVGDALARAGFAEPVLDIERITLTYPHIAALCHDLKATGARNATAARPRGLTTPRHWQRMVAAYETLRCNGTLPATCEVIYGASWGGGPHRGASMQHGEVSIPVSSIKHRGART